MDGLENGSHGIPSITSEVLHVLTKALKTSQIRVEALEKTLDDLKVEHKDCLVAVERTANEVNALLQKELQVSKEENRRLQERLDSLQDVKPSIKVEPSEFNDLKTQLREMELRLVESDSQSEEVRIGYEEEKSAKLRCLEQIESLKRREVELTAENSQLVARSRQLQVPETSSNSFSEQIESLKQREATLTAENSHLVARCKQLDDQVNEVTADRNGQSQKCEKLQSDATRIISILDNRIADSMSVCEGLRAEKSHYDERRSELEKYSLAVTAENMRMESAYSRLGALVVELTRQNASEAARSQELRTRLYSKCRKLNGHVTALTAKRVDEANKHGKDKERLASKCVQLQGQVTQLTGEIAREVNQWTLEARVNASKQSSRQASTPEVYSTPEELEGDDGPSYRRRQPSRSPSPNPKRQRTGTYGTARILDGLYPLYTTRLNVRCGCSICTRALRSLNYVTVGFHQDPPSRA